MFRRADKQRTRRTLEKRRLRNFLHRSAVVRWFIILISLVVIISLSIMGGRLEPLDLTVGQISPRTIVARSNFSYFDESATMQEQVRRASLAPNVYCLSMDVFRRDLKRAQSLLDGVALMKQSGKVTEARLKEIADAWNENSDIPLTPAEIQTLLYIPDKKLLKETLEKLSSKFAEVGITGDDQFSNSETSIAFALKPEEFSQLHYSKAGQFPTAGQVRQRILEHLSSSRMISKGSFKAIEKMVADLITPNLQLDLDLSRKLQDRQRKAVAPIYRNITKGNVLIERGERMMADKVAMLKAHEAEVEREFSKESRWRQRIGTALLVAVMVGIILLLLEFHPGFGPVANNREYALLATILVLHFAFCRSVIYSADTFTNLSPSLTSSILPLCFGPVLVAILLDRRRAHVAAFFTSFLMGVVTQFNFAVILTSLLSSLVGIHFVIPLRRRARIYEAGFMSGLAAAIVIFVFGFMFDVPWEVVGLQSGIAIAAACVASVLINAFLPILESVFKVTTDLRWLELSDLNHPLLRRMVMEAPGTYHHSLVVANLAERACEAIGAHALQARVCSYFHDIGKLNKPEYFCENQISGENPHDEIMPNMSALIIIAHVKDGIDMAIQHRLARPIINAIQQHHGTSQVTYFYRLAKRNEEDAKLGSKIMRMNVSDVPRVEEESYRYPGPKPKTREIGVISLADAVEGASRCMLKSTPQKIEAQIAEIIEERYHDGQLDHCPLSIRDLRLIKESFSKTILSMMHTRVSYPKDEPDIDQPAPFPSVAIQ